MIIPNTEGVQSLYDYKPVVDEELFTGEKGDFQMSKLALEFQEKDRGFGLTFSQMWYQSW